MSNFGINYIPEWRVPTWHLSFSIGVAKSVTSQWGQRGLFLFVWQWYAASSS